MALPTLIDTGPLVAIFNRRDAHHQKCTAALKQTRLPLLTCWPVITEAAYLLGEHSVGGRSLLSEIERGGIEILRLSVSDVAGITAILEKYADQSFQLADASLMYLAEREHVDRCSRSTELTLNFFERQAVCRLHFFPRLPFPLALRQNQAACRVQHTAGRLSLRLWRAAQSASHRSGQSRTTSWCLVVSRHERD